jgi:hypothetical protein
MPDIKDYSSDLPPALLPQYQALIDRGVKPWDARNEVLPPPDQVINPPSLRGNETNDLGIYGQGGLSGRPQTGDPVIGGGPTQFAPSMSNYTRGDYYNRYYPGPGAANTYPQMLATMKEEQQQGPPPPPQVQKYTQYATLPDSTMTRAGVPLGVLRDLVIGNESRSTAQARGVEPYDVLAIGPGVEHNARALPVNDKGFPDRAPVKSAWGYPSTGAGAYQFEKETYEDVAKVLGIKDFSKASQDAVFNYIATTAYGGKSGVFPWEKNTKLMPALKAAQQQYGRSRMAQAIWGDR